MLIDLHIHSNFSSDGERKPSEIYEIIKTKKINIFSITDHNTVKGVRNLLKSVKNGSVMFIPGVEFSCSFEGYEIHLLSYGFNHLDERYDFLEDNFKKIKREQAIRRTRKLQEIGFILNVEEVLEEAGEKAASGVTFLNVLKRYKENRQKLYDYLEGDKSNSPYTNFYFDFFRKGGFAYVEIKLLDYFEVVNILKDTFLVLAHPGLYPEELIGKLLIESVDGIEAYSSYHDIEQSQRFVRLASDKGLVVTCGSDHHGKNIKPNVEFINYELPFDVESRLIERLDSLKSYFI
ncbi:PHP domain-containing protein [Deferribacter autotrophicus]|uniref:PHP domain-containing protein n=1 Tax=Deferribacter autotrophicus TaxID=500465 RepID=A0A5A8F1T1_9BACT|nr:PHP domain-containing protein [Deferribacter autotrophicus]KAA0258060.1 PHP domain-containing protein [Deferribacter autotrophicus]